MNDWLDLTLLLASAIPSTAFCVIYAVLAPWWRSQEGVNLFGFTAVIAALFDVTLVLRATGPHPRVALIATLVLYTAAAVFLWQRLWLLLRANWRR